MFAHDLQSQTLQNFEIGDLHMNYDMEKTGQRIQQLRIQHQYTQKQLADKLNIDRSFLSYVESGKKGFSVDLLVQLSALLDASLEYIILGKKQDSALTAKNRVQLKADIEKLVSQLENFKSSL